MYMYTYVYNGSFKTYGVLFLAYDIAFREGKPYNVLLIIRSFKEGNNVEAWSGAYYIKKGRDEAFSELYKEGMYIAMSW